jgi:hypothetical protein
MPPKITRSADGKIGGPADDVAAPASYGREVSNRRSIKMNERTHDRLFAGCGIAFVVLTLLGAGIATAGGKTHNLTISSTPTQIAHAIAKPAGTAVWVGAYLEFLSVGAFLAFAIWACMKLGGGLLGAIGRAAATGYATVTITSLGIMAGIAYRAGHGISVQLASALVTVNEAVYVATWFLTVFFLLAAGALALAQMRRVLGWSAIGLAAVTLIGTAVSLENLGQMSGMLWFAWIVFASITLARRKRERSAVVAVAQRV